MDSRSSVSVLSGVPAVKPSFEVDLIASASGDGPASASRSFSSTPDQSALPIRSPPTSLLTQVSVTHLCTTLRFSRSSKFSSISRSTMPWIRSRPVRRLDQRHRERGVDPVEVRRSASPTASPRQPVRRPAARGWGASAGASAARASRHGGATSTDDPAQGADGDGAEGDAGRELEEAPTADPPSFGAADQSASRRRTTAGSEPRRHPRRTRGRTRSGRRRDESPRRRRPPPPGPRRQRRPPTSGVRRERRPRAARASRTMRMPICRAVLSCVPKSEIARSFSHGGTRSMKAEPIATTGVCRLPRTAATTPAGRESGECGEDATDGCADGGQAPRLRFVHLSTIARSGARHQPGAATVSRSG